MPTLEEIAKVSGYSRSTVSRVINNDSHVSEKARSRILKIVADLDYQPNVAARSLAAGRTQVIGLVIPTAVSILFTDPYFPILIKGVSSACNQHNHSVMLWLAEPEFERRTVQKVISNGLIDGVIVSSVILNDPIVRSLEASSLPFVLVGRHPNAPDASYVDVDNARSAEEAVMHLLRLGRRRVAAITGPLNMIAGADRYLGYRNALRLRGVVEDETLVVEGDFTEDGGYLAMQRLIPHHPDAVFAASDAMAVGALRALRDQGIQVPGQVALVGFDDVPLATHAEPPLTTVRQPIQQLGYIATETLIDMVETGDVHGRRVILPTQLVIRASCGTRARY
ncbi:MAG: LacI family DNA-binding transcriptional regulator [Anaerolineae bacterium]|nr:LacI family DNA-binding transcriptional regulator [Anaerolineae bacterium]